MRNIWAVTLLLLVSAAAPVQAGDETVIGTLPTDEAGLRALPGATLGKPTRTEDGGRSQILTYRGAKIDIRTANDGTRSFEEVGGTGAPPVLCMWQLAIAQEAVRERCASVWGDHVVSPVEATEALEAIEAYIRDNNVVPVTADEVRAERDKLAAPTREDFAGADQSLLADACAFTLMYVNGAFQPLEENGPPAWKVSIAKPAPVLETLCN